MTLLKDITNYVVEILNYLIDLNTINHQNTLESEIEEETVRQKEIPKKKFNNTIKESNMEKKLFMQERGVHPLTKVSLEERVSYLKAVAVFVALENADKKKFSRLIKLLECEDVKEDLVAFLEDVTEEQSVEIFESLEEKLRLKVAIEIIHTFKVDITQLEYSFVNDLLKVSRQVLFLLHNLISSIKSGNSNILNETYLKVLEFEGLLYEVIGEFASVYGFEDEHSLQEIVDDFIFAGSNEHKKIYQPKYMNTKSISIQKNIMLKLISQDGNALEYADDYFKEDKDFVLTSVTQNGWALRYADVSFQKDREFVLAVAANDPRALIHADDTLREDREFILEVIAKNGSALLYIDSDFQEDKEIALTAVRNDGLAFFYLDDIFKEDKEIILTAIKQNKDAIKFVDSSLIEEDREIALTAVKLDAISVLLWAGDNLRKDKEIMIAAIKQNKEAIKYADDSLQEDKDIQLALKA